MTQFRLVHDIARQRAIEAIKTAPDGYVVTVAEPTRNGDQNAALHAMLTDIAAQVEWAGAKMDIEDWKRLFVAAQWGQKVIPSLDGKGFVVLNQRTSKLSKSACSDLIESIAAWGAERGVRFSDRRAA